MNIQRVYLNISLLQSVQGQIMVIQSWRRRLKMIKQYSKFVESKSQLETEVKTFLLLFKKYLHFMFFKEQTVLKTKTIAVKKNMQK